MVEAVTSQEALSLWTLEEISRLVSNSGNPSETLNNVVHLLQRRFQTDVCSVYLLDFERAKLVLSATIGLSPTGIGTVSMPLDEGLVGLVAESRAPLMVPVATRHPRFKYFPDAGEDSYKSFLGVPVLVRGLVHGVLVLQTSDERHFHEQDVRMMTAAAAQLGPILVDASLAQRRGAERELVLRAKTDLLETLAGGIAHELNNKLMPVSGFAELMLEQAQALALPDFVDHCRIVRDSVLEAARILQQLLRLSRPSSIDREVCDFRQIVEEALMLVRLRAKEGGATLTMDLGDDELRVHADAGQLKQVLVNLVWNAIDAVEPSAEKRIAITAQAHRGTITLACADSGTGIPAAVMPRIFDPFFTTKGPHRGTGLGLSMSLAIVRQHGGDIRVSSQLGAGTTVFVSLPLTREPKIVPPQPAAPAVVDRSQHHRVLVVDDEERLLQLVDRVLTSRLGCSVRRARNGLEARAALEDEPFDLVLSDVRMPHMNGVELLRWIRDHRDAVLPRTVFMSGDDSEAGLNEAIRGAGRPLLRKPISVEALVDVAGRVITC